MRGRGPSTQQMKMNGSMREGKAARSPCVSMAQTVASHLRREWKTLEPQLRQYLARTDSDSLFF